MSDRLGVRQIAQGRWRGILPALGLDDRFLSGRHTACPMCGGKDRFRFDDKEGRGTFYCSGCGPGDGVQLAMACTGLPFKDLAQQIERLAGVVQPTTKVVRTDDEKIVALRRVWMESAPICHGDEVCRYLAGRGLALGSLPESLRLHPGLAYHDDEGVLMGRFPAMLALVTGSDGKPLSMHRTYLKDARKAPVPAPKKLMQGGAIAGAAIRLAPVSRSLGIAEGIETAMAASELFQVPVWSCISTTGIESFEPPEGVDELIVFADHDANFAGQSAAYRAAHRLALKGYSVVVRFPPYVGDWLDELNRRRAPTEGRATTCNEFEETA